MGNARLFLLLINISLALCAAGKLTVRLEPSDGRLFALPGKLGLACFIKPNGKASLGRYHYQQGLFTEINPHALRRRLKLRALRLAQEIRKLSSQGFNKKLKSLKAKRLMVNIQIKEIDSGLKACQLFLDSYRNGSSSSSLSSEYGSGCSQPDNSSSSKSSESSLSLSFSSSSSGPSCQSGSDIYVDLQLASDCEGTYSIKERNCSGSDGFAYPSLQKAADAVYAGDTVHIRQGVYENKLNYCAGSICKLVKVFISGTQECPITFQPYQGEQVILQGFGFEDADLNGDGLADGPAYPQKRETLFSIEADHIHLRGLELTNSQQVGLNISAKHSLVEHLWVHDNWTTGVLLNEGARNNHLRFLEIHNSRHHNGISLSLARDNLIEHVLSYKNGRQSDGRKVLPISGDPTGGGNSDGFGAFKACYDNAAPGENLCTGNTYRNIIAFGNTDDGGDFSMSHSTIEDCISFANGPEGNRGFKILRAVPLLNFYRNIALTNGSRGFEFRGSVVAIGNLTLYHSGSGMTGIQSDDTVLNNAGAYNTGGDLLISASCGWCSDNWAQDQSGVDPRFSDPVASAGGGFSVDTDFPTGLDIAGKIAFIRSQFSRAFTPAAGSLRWGRALRLGEL